jgi:hypothetical protein
MPKLRRIAIVVLAFLGAAVVANRLLPEGLTGLALSIAFSGEEVTKYAPSYSGFTFWRLRTGSTQEEVVRRLGEPLEKSEGTYGGKRLLFWKYTTSPTKSHYHQRWLIFGNNGRVEEKVSEFFVD